MMAKEPRTWQRAFFVPRDLGERVPPDHLLRRIAAVLDLSFVEKEVQGKYGAVGNVSLPPTTIIKLMLLFTLYKVEFERKFFRELPMRIDWLWFIGYDLSTVIPNHSVLSKARKRWGKAVFDELLTRTIGLCIKAGLVDGHDVLADSSLIDANASADSLFKIASQVTASATSRLDKTAGEPEPARASGRASSEPNQGSEEPAGGKPEAPVSPASENEPVVEPAPTIAQSSLIEAEVPKESTLVPSESNPNEQNPDEPEAADPTAPAEAKYRSTTDPDATGAKRRGEMRMRPRYQTHRMIDSAHGVITATVLGPGHENEAHRLEELLVQHGARTHQRVTTLTADSKYGTADNLEFCEVNQITAYINPLRNTQIRRKPGIFTDCCFLYDEASDTYTCPAGQKLIRTQYRTDRDAYRYSAPPEACLACPARSMCTKSKQGRTISRQVRQPILDRATARLKTPEGRAHRKLRQSKMEGSFAHSVRLGYKRAHARGLTSVSIQDKLVAAVQNLLILFWPKLRKASKPVGKGPKTRLRDTILVSRSAVRRHITRYLTNLFIAAFVRPLPQVV